MKSIFLIVMAAAVACAQYPGGGFPPGGGSGAGFTQVSSLPSTCTVGTMAFLTTGTPAPYYCGPNANTWNLINGGGTVTITASSGVQATFTSGAGSGAFVHNLGTVAHNLFCEDASHTEVKPVFAKGTNTDTWAYTGGLPANITCTAIAGGLSGGSQTWPVTPGIVTCTGTPCTAYGSSVAAPSGAIVGTTDMQTLTNKTVDGVTPTVFGYLDLTSSVQTQLNGKAGKLASTRTVSGTSDTLLSTDAGKIVTYTSAEGIIVTIHDGLGVGFNCTLVQLGAGVVTPSASGATFTTSAISNGTGSSISIVPAAVDTYLMYLSSSGIQPLRVAYGTAALGTSALASGTCYGDSAQPGVVVVSAPGTLTTDVVMASFNSDPHGVTGYIPSTSGMLTILSYPTADNVNFMVCNNTANSITPGAITLNWRVFR